MKKKKLASRLLTSSITAAMMLQALPFASFGAVYAEAQAEEEALRNELLSYAEEFPEGAVAFYEEGTTICEGSEDQEITVVRLGDPSEAMSVDVKAYDVTAQYGTDYTLYVKQKLQKDYADDSQVTAPKVQTAMEDGSFQDMLTQEDATPEDVLNGEAVTPAEEQTPILEETSAEETSAEETPVEEAPAEETPAEETSAEEETTEDAEYEVIPAQVAETTETEQPSSEEEDGGSLRQAFREQTGKDTINTNWRGEYDQEQLEEAAKEADNQVVDSFDGALLTLDFAPGEYKKTLYIHIEDDDKAEITESTALVLGNATSGLLGVNMQYTVNIEDNEEEQPVTFAMKDTEVITDRSASYAEITVERTTGLDYYANMTWRTASGTAESMNAYVPVDSGSVNFVPGQTEATIRVELTENAQIGTYFTVLIDQNMNIVEEDHAETIVWVGSKSANTDDLLETPDIFSRVKALPQPQTASTPATVLSEDAIDVSKYHTQVIGGNGWYTLSPVVELPALPEKAYMKIDYSYYAGSDDTMSISFGNYEPFSKVQLKGNKNEFQNGSVFLDVSSFQKSDTLCFRTEKFFSSYVMIKSVTLYYTDSYTVITSQEQRNLDAYNYSSPILKQPFKVAAIKDWQNSYAHETVTVASDGNPETFKNFTSRLEQGVYVDSLDVYAGSETENNYISDVMLIGADKDKEAREKVSQYTAQGWQFIDYDLNKSAGGHYIYLLYKTSPSYSDAIKDFVIRTGYKNWNNNYTHNGRTYNTAGYDGDKTFVNNHADLNEEAGAGSTYMYLYYTKQGGDGYGVTNIWFNETKSGGVKDTSGDVIDLNERGGGKYIYMHTSSEPSRCLGTVKFDGSITYNTIASLNNTSANSRAISNAGGKFYVIPHYATRKAKVNFLAEEGSVVSFSGDKKGETGFQENRAFVCTQIDKVTITATDLTKGQNIYPSNILRSSYHSATVDGKQVRLKDDEHMLYAQDQTDTASLTRVVTIDYEEEDFTACYNRHSSMMRTN